MQSSRQLIVRTSVLAVAALASVTLVSAQEPARPGPSPTPRAESLVRHYFKETLPLVLDTELVGLLAPSGLDVARLPAQLDPAGIVDLAVPGWHRVRLSEPATAETLSALLDRLAIAPDCEFVSPVFRDEFGPLMVTPWILIRFQPSVDRADAIRILESTVPGAVIEKEWVALGGVWRVRTSERNGLKLLDAANTLAQRSDVVFAEPDFIFSARFAQDVPGDPMFAFSWGLYGSGSFVFETDIDIGALGAWAVTQGDPGVRVAVLDCGIDPFHPDLNQAPGADFTTDDGDGGPQYVCDNHGTWVAGCISSFTDNGLGTVGVAPQCQVVSARVLISDSCSQPTVMASWVTEALGWVVTHGIHITNTSFHMPESGAVSTAYASTHGQGVVHFAAAGNDGAGLVSYPASLPTVISVGATFIDGHRAWFSNYGAELDVMAPGWWIRTTDRVGAPGETVDDYAVMAGTSLATAMAAGVAALLRSVQPSLSPSEIENLLAVSARDLEIPGWDELTGWGQIRADRALSALLGQLEGAEFSTCDSPDFSARGDTLAFASHSAHLVPGDANGKRDVFVRHLPSASPAGSIASAGAGSPGLPAGPGAGVLPVGESDDELAGLFELVSLSSSGEQGNDESRGPAISADGRYVAFESYATNLVPGDDNGDKDIFLRDRLLGTTVRVSVATGGIQSNGESSFAAISADGRYVAFNSRATNLVLLATNGHMQIYLRDTWTGTTVLVSRTPTAAGNDDSWLPSISANGKRVAFMTLSDNLAAAAYWPNIILADLAAFSLTLVNVDSSGQSLVGQAAGAVISADGERVAFTTDQPLAPNDTNGLNDAYVRDIATDTTLAGSVDAAGDFGDRDAYAEALSRDGRYLLFSSAASGFVPADTNGHVDVFRKDLLTGEVVRVSVGNSFRQATAGSGHPWISPDGRWAGFTCRDDALVPGDALDDCSDVYRRDVLAETTELLTPGS